jgi:hypothetical protein
MVDWFRRHTRCGGLVSPAARGKIIVAGVSVEEILVAVKETSNKKTIWNKE